MLERKFWKTREIGLPSYNDLSTGGRGSLGWSETVTTILKYNQLNLQCKVGVNAAKSTVGACSYHSV
jgi:hypothetical protein